MSISDIIFISKRGNYLRLSEMARMEKTALFDLRYSPDKLAYKSGVDAFNITSGTSYQIINSKFVNIKVGEYEDAGDSDVYTGYAEPHLDYTKHITIPIYPNEKIFYDNHNDALYMTYTTYPEYHFLPLPNTDFIADIDNPLVWSRVYLHDFDEYREDDAKNKPLIEGQKLKFDIDLYNFSDNTYAVFQIVGSYALDNFRLPYLNNSNNNLLEALFFTDDMCVEKYPDGSIKGIKALNILSITDITLLKPSQSNKDNYELIAYSGVDKPPAFRKKNFEIELSFPEVTFLHDGFDNYLIKSPDYGYVNPRYLASSGSLLFFSRFGQVNNLYYFFYTVFVKADSMEEGRQKLYDLTGKYYDNTTADDEILVGSYFRPNYLEVGDDFIFMRNTDSPRTIGGVIPFIPTIAALFSVGFYDGLLDSPSRANSSYNIGNYTDTANYFDRTTFDDFLTGKDFSQLQIEKYIDNNGEVYDIEGSEVSTYNITKLAYITNGVYKVKYSKYIPNEDCHYPQLSKSREFTITNTIPFIGEYYPEGLEWVKDRIILIKDSFPRDAHIHYFIYTKAGRGLSRQSVGGWSDRSLNVFKQCSDGVALNFNANFNCCSWGPCATDIHAPSTYTTIWCNESESFCCSFSITTDFSIHSCNELNDYTYYGYKNYLKCLYNGPNSFTPEYGDNDGVGYIIETISSDDYSGSDSLVGYNLISVQTGSSQEYCYCGEDISCLSQLYFDFSSIVSYDYCSYSSPEYYFMQMGFYMPVYLGRNNSDRYIAIEPHVDNFTVYACEVIPYRPKNFYTKYDERPEGYYCYYDESFSAKIPMNFCNMQIDPRFIYTSPYYYIPKTGGYNFLPFRYNHFGESIGSIFS